MWFSQKHHLDCVPYDCNCNGHKGHSHGNTSNDSQHATWHQEVVIFNILGPILWCHVAINGELNKAKVLA